MSLDINDKTKWVNALRSGEYQQGKAVLHNPTQDTYCCLGVLCEVTGREFKAVDPGNDNWNDLDANDAIYSEFRELFSAYDIPPNEVLYEPHNVMDRLMHWNDAFATSGHKDFPQIADWVEANL